YFADMTKVLQGLAHQTVPGAVVCIDIGDSRYAGVNVPTPLLLSQVAETAGFTTREIRPLRTRRSKDKTELSQDLVVLERTVTAVVVPGSCPAPAVRANAMGSGEVLKVHRPSWPNTC